MVSDALKPNVQDLQRDVIELLEQISALMGSASTQLWSKDGTENKYEKYREQIANEARKVENLELRMAITAPMKAGKSTIINAIVGQELLPSRNAAMTTLPTEIVFNTELKEPVLKLSTTIVSSFQETWLVLKRKIEEFGIDRIQERIAQYPHLIELLEEIQDKVGFPIRAKTYGRDEILKTLASLNDIIRLCSKIAPLADPLRSLTDVPRIETPLLRTQATAQPQILGNLVIVDTPGPNEAGENLRLAAVVEEQLQKSSLVLIVLDYTQLKTKAAEDVKEEVEKVIQIRGKENLYVLVNKIDQRTDSDMTPEQVRQFVAAEFGIDDSGNTDRVFEISARRAFYATNFQLELQQQPNISIDRMQTARALAQQAFGDMWEILFQNANVDQMQQASQQVWNRSGFAPFLDQAINALMAEAAPRCIRDALNIARVRLVELRDGVKLRRSAITRDADNVKAEIDRLEQDLLSLKDLKECPTGLREKAEEKKSELNRRLKVTLKRLKDQSEKALQKYFLEEISQKLNQFQKLDVQGRKVLLKQINIPILTGLIEAVESIFPESLSQLLKYEVALLGLNQVKFKTKSEAEAFAEQLCSEAKQILERLMRNYFDDIENQIQEVQVDLNNLFKQKTRENIERACNRLNKAFDLDLKLPPIILDEDINKDSLSAKVSVEQRQTNFGENIVGFFSSIFNFGKSQQDGNLYTVSLEKTVKQINRCIETKIKDTENDISKYLDEDFPRRMGDFFKDLDDYLQNYQDSLTQALEDQGSSLENQEDLKEVLDSFAEKAEMLIEKIDKSWEFTSQMIQIKKALNAEFM
jgi:GTPase SAR1 family protein